MEGKVFHSSVEVRYAETDASGYVNVVNYLTWFDTARDQFMIEIGLPYSEFEAAGYGMPLLHYRIEFDRPVRYGAKAHVYSAIVSVQPSRIVIAHELYATNPETGELEHACSAKAKMAFIDEREFKSTDLQTGNPAFYRKLCDYITDENIGCDIGKTIRP